MAATQPDYGAIQRGWIRAYQARPEFFTVKAQLEAAEKNLDEATKVLDAQRPSFKFANAQTYVDRDRLAERLAYYRSVLDGDPSGFPFVYAALTFGRDIAAEYADVAPEGAVDTLRAMKLAPMRGDLSASVGLLWVATEGVKGWEQSVWDSWLLAVTAGPVAEILTDAGVDADAQVILKEVTGRTRAERRKGLFEGVATAVGIAAAGFGVLAGIRAWRGK